MILLIAPCSNQNQNLAPINYYCSKCFINLLERAIIKYWIFANYFGKAWMFVNCGVNKKCPLSWLTIFVFKLAYCIEEKIIGTNHWNYKTFALHIFYKVTLKHNFFSGFSSQLQLIYNYCTQTLLLLVRFNVSHI